MKILEGVSIIFLLKTQPNYNLTISERIDRRQVRAIHKSIGQNEAVLQKPLELQCGLYEIR